MVDFHFQNAAKTVDCLVKVDMITPVTTGGRGTIMEIRDIGSIKFAQNFNKGVSVSQTDLKAIAVANAANSVGLKQYVEGQGQGVTTIV